VSEYLYSWADNVLISFIQSRHINGVLKNANIFLPPSLQGLHIGSGTIGWICHTTMRYHFQYTHLNRGRHSIDRWGCFNRCEVFLLCHFPVSCAYFRTRALTAGLYSLCYLVLPFLGSVQMCVVLSYYCFGLGLVYWKFESYICDLVVAMVVDQKLVSFSTLLISLLHSFLSGFKVTHCQYHV